MSVFFLRSLSDISSLFLPLCLDAGCSPISEKSKDSRFPSHLSSAALMISRLAPVPTAMPQARCEPTKRTKHGDMPANSQCVRVWGCMSLLVYINARARQYTAYKTHLSTVDYGYNINTLYPRPRGTSGATIPLQAVLRVPASTALPRTQRKCL